MAQLKPTAVNRVLAEVRQVEKMGHTTVSLMRGQPDLPTPAHVVAAAQQALARGRTGYPDNRGEAPLRQAVAAKLGREQQLTYDPESEVVVTDGATGGLFTALAVLVEPGTDVLLPSPIYDAYHSPIALWGGRPVAVPASRVSGRYTLSQDSLAAVCTPRARVLLLNTPWNPVGTVFQRRELNAILEFALARNLWVISDEIYETLVYDGRRHLSPAALSMSARQRTLLVNSLSKTYAMTGWRVGYCAGPRDVIEAMTLVWQQFSRGPATFVQDAAACALQSDQACVQVMVAELQSRRDLVLKELEDIPGVLPLVPEGGLFVMVDVSGLGRPSEVVRRFLLQDAGVVVIDGAAFGPGGEGTLRVSFAGGGPTLTEGLRRLRDGLLRLALDRTLGV
jgi:aspartate/methionine/tyrosine aminotransferase